jgi:hypothetical protein
MRASTLTTRHIRTSDGGVCGMVPVSEAALEPGLLLLALLALLPSTEPEPPGDARCVAFSPESREVCA